MSKHLQTPHQEPSALPGLPVEIGLQELPVITMLLELTANARQKIGTLIDLASDQLYHPQGCKQTKPQK